MTTRTVQRLACAAVLAVAAVGCASVNVSTVRYIGAPRLAPTDPNAVEILRRVPRRPHEKLGQVVLQPSGNPPVEDLEKAIRTAAAQMGADAAVLVFDRTRRVGTVVEGPWWDRTAYPVYGRRIVAVAIHYR